MKHVHPHFYENIVNIYWELKCSSHHIYSHLTNDVICPLTIPKSVLVSELGFELRPASLNYSCAYPYAKQPKE